MTFTTFYIVLYFLFAILTVVLFNIIPGKIADYYLKKHETNGKQKDLDLYLHWVKDPLEGKWYLIVFGIIWFALPMIALWIFGGFDLA